MIKYELTIKDPTKLKFNLNKIPEKTNIHLTDKGDNASPFEVALGLVDREVTITFALRNHYHFGKLDLITQDLDKYISEAKKVSNITELLIVSGSDRGVIDTLKVLDYLKGNDNQFRIGVAYNCSHQDQEEENQRLITKLSHPFVKSVYIQITDDLIKIGKGIKFIRSIRPDIYIAVCVIKPSNSLFNSFRLRPWKGVVLSEQYLGDLNRANTINAWNIKNLSTSNVDILMTV
jgi:hypothetical protein